MRDLKDTARSSILAVLALLLCPPAAIAQTPGLVAAYGFNEGSGTSMADVSGNNNIGTLTSGASWSTQGKFGNALSFNGSSGRVDIVDAPSLRLTNAMTLEAWVNPTTVSGGPVGWRDVLYKGNDNYFLEAVSTHVARPRWAARSVRPGAARRCPSTPGLTWR